MGYGRSESRATAACSSGTSALLGTYWSAADIIQQHIAKKEGGFDKLKGEDRAGLPRLAFMARN